MKKRLAYIYNTANFKKVVYIMNCLLEKFIFAEQVLNNYDLYNGTDRENSFKMNLKSDFLPENQKIFSLPYFLISIVFFLCLKI